MCVTKSDKEFLWFSVLYSLKSPFGLENISFIVPKMLDGNEMQNEGCFVYTIFMR